MCRILLLSLATRLGVVMARFLECYQVVGLPAARQPTLLVTAHCGRD